MRFVVLLAVIAAWVAAFLRYRAMRREASRAQLSPTLTEVSTGSRTRTQRFKSAVLTMLGLGPADRR